MRTEALNKTNPDKVQISFQPSMRKEDGIQARADAAKIVQATPDKPHYTDSLQLAIALSLYNARNTKDTTKSQKRALETRAHSLAADLIHTESMASHTYNFLPTIGIEVEVPQVNMKYDYEAQAVKYARFFDAIGMPRNRSNGNLNDIKSRWEFSPRPSYSAQVQARILSELIQGGFIPHLENSKDPKHVEEHLDEHLVSLHINLGKPAQGVLHPTQVNEVEDLAKALAIGYSSALRLENRKTPNRAFAETARYGDMVPLQKNGIWGQGRIELRGMEVLGSNSYRALYEAQDVFGLFFQAYKYPKSEYKELYNGMMRDVKAQMQKGGYKFLPITDYQADSYEISRVAGRPDIAKGMRKIIHSYTKAKAQRYRFKF